MVRVCIAAMLLLAASPASAEIAGYAGLSVQAEDNIFRVADSSLLPTTASRNDVIYGLSAGITARALLPGWTTNLEARLTQNWFDRNKALDNLGYTLGASISRQAERDDIAVDARQERALSSFSELRGSDRNLQTLTTATVRSTLYAIGDFGITAGGGYVRSTNSRITESDYDRFGTVVGITYRSQIGNRISAEWRHGEATGLNERMLTIDGLAVPDRLSFTEDRYGVASVYSLTPFITLSGDGGYTIRRDRSILNNDFSGWTGRLSGHWLPRDTIRVDLTVARQLESTSQLFVDAIRVSSAMIAADGDITPSTVVRASYSIERRDYLASPDIVRISEAERQTIDRLQLSATRQLGDRASVTVSGVHEQRSGSLAGSSFNANAIDIAFRLKFTNGVR